jgi:hypothetical protein
MPCLGKHGPNENGRRESFADKRKRKFPTSLCRRPPPTPKNPTALHLRAMNTLYEAIQERGSLVIVPSSAVESMGARSNPGNRVARRSKTLTIQAK